MSRFDTIIWTEDDRAVRGTYDTIINAVAAPALRMVGDDSDFVPSKGKNVTPAKATVSVVKAPVSTSIIKAIVPVVKPVVVAPAPVMKPEPIPVRLPPVVIPQVLVPPSPTPAPVVRIVKDDEIPFTAPKPVVVSPEPEPILPPVQAAQVVAVTKPIDEMPSIVQVQTPVVVDPDPSQTVTASAPTAGMSNEARMIGMAIGVGVLAWLATRSGKKKSKRRR